MCYVFQTAVRCRAIPMQYMCYDYMFMIQLCYVQLFRTLVRCRGQGPCSSAVRCRGQGPSSSGLRSDAEGKALVLPDFSPMQWERPNTCYMCFCMVGGSLGELTKLRAYHFSFGFRYFSFQKRSSRRLQCTHHRLQPGIY